MSGSGLRKSGGKGKKQSKESMRASLDSRLVHTLWTGPGLDCVDLVFTLVWFSRGSAELLEEPGVRVSPSESMTSIPTCMPFSWFGEKDRDRDRDPSSSSSSLPYTATDASEHSHNSKNKVRYLYWSKYCVYMRSGIITKNIFACHLNITQNFLILVVRECTSDIYWNTLHARR